MSYWRFGAMILTSTVTMFVLMYLNTYALEHVFFSETRAYMAVLMGATMAVIMLSFMLSMYGNRIANLAIFSGAILLFAGSLWLVRSQETVQDRSFLRAMIPHHSIAIMTSQRAELTDARARKLAHEIVLAQNREISEMRYLIADMERSGEVGEVYEDPQPRLGTLEDALDMTRIAALDPAPLALADLPGEAGAEGLDCGFRRVRSEDPVLWTGEQAAAMKLNGVIIALERQDGDESHLYGAPGVTMELRSVEGGTWRGDTELIFALERGPEVGYRGFHDCEA